MSKAVITIKLSPTMKEILKYTAKLKGMTTSDYIRQQLHHNLALEEDLTKSTQQYLEEEARDLERKQTLALMKFNFSQAFSTHRTIQHFDKLFKKENRVPNHYIDTAVDLQLRYIQQCDNPKAQLHKLRPYFKARKYQRGVDIIDRTLASTSVKTGKEIRLFFPPHKVGGEKKSEDTNEQANRRQSESIGGKDKQLRRPHGQNGNAPYNSTT